jgi:imidazolonepropionase-like amidohydrolase/Tol biopolymer transport system component
MKVARHASLSAVLALATLACSTPTPSPTSEGSASGIEVVAKQATWSSVTVHPGEDSFHFDALGQIYRADADDGSVADASPALSGEFLTRFPDAISHSPAISPDGRRLAFVSDAGGRENVWLAQRGGGRERRLSDLSGAAVSGLAWMPSGRALIARVRTAPTEGRIWRFPLSGDASPIEPETPLQDMQGPHPHGEWIYFATTLKPPGPRPLRRERWLIARMPADGGHVETVVETEGGAVRPRISPDGRWLAYVTWRQGRSQLVVRDRRGSRRERVIAEVGRNLQDIYIAQLDLFPGYTLTDRAVWVSIDGIVHRIELASGERQTFAPRFSRRVDPTRPARPAVPIPEDGMSVRSLRWPSASADGETLVFEALGRIWIAGRASDDAGPRALTPEDENCSQPDLSADGLDLLFVCDSGNGRWRIEAQNLRDDTRTTIAAGEAAWAAPRWIGENARMVAVRSDPLPALGIFGERDRSIVTMDADGSDAQVIAEAVTGAGGAWPTDHGRGLVFRDERNLRNWSRKTGSVRDIANLGRATAAIPRPDGARWLIHIDGHVLNVDRRKLAQTLASANERTWGFSNYPGEIGAFPAWFGETGYVFARPGRIELRDKDAKHRVEIEIPVEPEVGTGTLALVHARLITMDASGVIENGHVIIEGGEIVRVGRADRIAVPESAHVIDLEGKTVLPGLIDVHQHALFLMGFDPLANIPRDFSPPAALLAHGVTSTRDPALFDNARDFAIVERINVGRMKGPRYFATGQRLRPDEYPVRSPADAAAAVSHAASFGATAVKQYLYPDRRQRRWIADAARSRDLRSAFESGYDYKLGLSALLDGFNSIEHSPGNHALFEDFIRLAAGVDADYVPTLMTQIGAERFFGKTDIETSPRLQRWLPAAWRLQLINRQRRGAGIDPAETAYAALTRNAAAMAAAGMDVGVGAHDNPSPTGLGTLWEIAALVDGGLSEQEALRSATIEGARIIGIDHRTGSITAGKLADLVVLDHNPLEDITALEQTAMIVFRGIALDPLTLEPLKESVQ